MKRILPYLLLTSILAMTACDEKKDDKGVSIFGYYLYGTPIDILNQGSKVMVLAIGMTLVIATGGIDISVGAVGAISGAVFVKVLDAFGLDRISVGSIACGLVAAIAVTIVFTLFNGTLVSMVKSHQAEADKAYRKACQEYEVPASGVIANLNDMIKGIDKVKTTQDMYRYESGRLGVLRNLDHVHLCVEQNDKKNISEVKRLALTLKNLYESKKHELGMK